MKDIPPENQLKDTLRNLQDALNEWDKIPDNAESEMDKFRKKTQELVKRLNEQIKALGL
ncbi:MAG: hypothetical protein SGI74_13805 [Oligoflexia bacterium]|nr:hypothetical protein [Oligoflexia bacterium]